MPKALKSAIFRTEPWGWEIALYHGNSNTFTKHVKRQFSIDVDLEGSLGQTLFKENYPVIIWVESIKNIPTLVHELMHAVFKILGTRGVSLCSESEEAYTYTMSRLLHDVLMTKKWKDIKA